MDTLITNHWIIALVGWAAFIVISLSMDKDLKDESGQAFPIGPYIQTKWDNWLASLVCVPVLVIIGRYGMDLSLTGIQWADLYYLAAGIAPEFIKNQIARFRKKS